MSKRDKTIALFAGMVLVLLCVLGGYLYVAQLDGTDSEPAAKPLTAKVSPQPDATRIPFIPTEIVPDQVDMTPQEAVRRAVKLAQGRRSPPFGRLMGQPEAVFGRLLTYERAYGYYSYGDNDRYPPVEPRTLVWLVILDGEVSGECEVPGCSHMVGPWPPSYPYRPGEDAWRQVFLVMDADSGRLLLRSSHHLGRLRSTEDLEDLARHLDEPPAPARSLLEAHGIEPHLARNLLFIAHWDRDAGRWLVHDTSREFTPDQLTPPQGVDIPDYPEFGLLTGLERGELYDFHVRHDQIINIVQGETGDWHFTAGTNFIEWPR